MPVCALPDNVILRAGLLNEAGLSLRALGVKRWAILADETVMGLYGGALLGALQAAGLQGNTFSFPAGESSKTLDTYAGLLRAMALSGFSRSDGVIALGGGMSGDLAGFVASTYLRGVTLVHIPTTLLAACDSCLGGKTGLDLPQGKNLIGTFYPAAEILIDPNLLSTLPARQFASGLAEVIKCGMIADVTILDELDKDKPDLPTLIYKCLCVKADLVARDETDLNVRRLLNIGHTFGHAYEAAGKYAIHTHGEAVAAGMAQMLRWELAHGYDAYAAYARLMPLLTRYGLLAELPYTNTELRHFLLQDKKHSGDTITIAVVETPGQGRLAEVSLAELWGGAQ